MGCCERSNMKYWRDNYQSWFATVFYRFRLFCITWLTARTDGVLNTRHKSRLAAIAVADSVNTVVCGRGTVPCGQRGAQVGEYLVGYRLLPKSNSTIAYSRFFSLLWALSLAHFSGIMRLVPGNIWMSDCRPLVIIVHHNALGDMGTIAMMCKMFINNRKS